MEYDHYGAQGYNDLRMIDVHPSCQLFGAKAPANFMLRGSWSRLAEHGSVTLILDEAYAARVVSDLDGSQAREKVLLDPVWHSQTAVSQGWGPAVSSSTQQHFQRETMPPSSRSTGTQRRSSRDARRLACSGRPGTRRPVRFPELLWAPGKLASLFQRSLPRASQGGIYRGHSLSRGPTLVRDEVIEYVRLMVREQAKGRKAEHYRQQARHSAAPLVEQRTRDQKRHPLPELDAYERLHP